MGNVLNWFKNIVSSCHTCHGTGVLPGSISDDAQISCPICHGKGVLDKEECVTHTVETPCDNPTCKNGKVKKTSSASTNGTVEEDCPVCNGLSRIVREVEESYISHRTCPACQGTGMVTGKTLRKKHLEVFCPDCHGVGKQVKFSRLLVLLPALAVVALNPLVAFVLLMFGSIVFSLFAVRANKSRELLTPDEIYEKSR